MIRRLFRKDRTTVRLRDMAAFREHLEADCLHGVCLLDGDATTPDGLLGLSLSWRAIEKPFGRAAWSFVDQGERYTTRFELHEMPGGWLLDVDCEGRGRFFIHPTGIDIDWEGGTGFAHYLQSIGIAIWLELRGIVCLHANALQRDGRAIGLLAPSRMGKTTLTAKLLDNGWGFLTDDMLALHKRGPGWVVFPSWPRMRMWPDIGAALGGSAFDQGRPVHRRFSKRSVGLAGQRLPNGKNGVRVETLYVLDRVMDASASVTLIPVDSAEAAILLMRNSIIGSASAAMGLQKRRLALISAILTRVNVIRLCYPDGLMNLELVSNVIE